MAERFITVAIHTYDKAVALRSLLEREGIAVEFRNVNIEQPVVASGVRVRIKESDLPLALRIIENRELFSQPAAPMQGNASSPIVVPVDFSDRSFDAALSAFYLATRHHTTITLLHTYIDPYVAGNLQLTDSMTYEITDADTREKIQSIAEAQMRHFGARLKEKIKEGIIPAVKFSTAIVEGVPEDAIVEYVRVNNPFLIVMATRGPEKKEIDMIGSVTAEVLDRCRFPVLSIPDTDRTAPNPLKFKSILFFGNLDQQDILAMDTFYRTFPEKGIKVTIALLPSKKRQIIKDSKGAIKALLGYCRQNFKGYTFDVAEISRENSVDDVKALGKDNPFDLIVVPNKKKNIFSRLFSPTLAHRILFISKVPMLEIPV